MIGQIQVSLKVKFLTVSDMEVEPTQIPKKELFTQGSGKEASDMVGVYLNIEMEVYMKAIGREV
jgi:hypothetical protein